MIAGTPAGTLEPSNTEPDQEAANGRVMPSSMNLLRQVGRSNMGPWMLSWWMSEEMTSGR